MRLKRRPRGNSAGFTLVEVLIVTVILSVSTMAIIKAQMGMSEGIMSTRDMTIAMTLAEEKVEALKSLPFYQVAVTSDTELDSDFSPVMAFDAVFYAPEAIRVGGTYYTRRTLVEKVDAPFGTISNMGYPHPDTGLKRISVYVVWTRRGDKKKVQVSSLKVNPDREPLEKTVQGTVTDSITGLPAAGVQIAARRNPGWGSVTDAAGFYNFQATDNTMRLVASKAGYHGYDSGSSFPLPTGLTTWNFQVVQIGSRTVAGYAVHRPNLVISQICANDNGREFVEIYNPSTFTITMTDKKIKYMDENAVVSEIPLNFLTNSIPANGYFFILGSPNGSDTTSPTNGKLADATYDNMPNDIHSAKDGGISITTAFDVVIDSVGWGNPAPAGSFMGNYFVTFPGMGTQTSLIRKAVSTSTVAEMSPPGGTHIPLGNAWNSLDNAADWVKAIGVTWPRNSADANVPAGGTILPYAFISVDDPVSSVVQAYATGYFTMTVATGTWNFFVASATLQSTFDLTVTDAPEGRFLHATATSTSNMGFITGELRKFSSPTNLITGLLVQADPGGYQTVSVAPGKYFFALPADEYFITGNPDFDNPNYNTAMTETPITVQPGIVTSGVHLSIWFDGWISGRVTAGGDGIGRVSVTAAGGFANGNSAVTNAAGFYTIKGLRLIGNPYSVSVSLDSRQTSTPGNYTVSVTKGGNDIGNDFDVAGLSRDITGAVTDAGLPIQTGVLIMASSGTINLGSPPVIDFALRGGADYFFQTFSDTEGRYALSVPGGQTYNLAAWYTKDGQTTGKSLASLYVSPSTGTTGADLSWP